MNFNETSPTLNCGNILPQFLQEKVINLKIGEKTYNQGWGNLTIGRSHFNDVIIKDKSVSAFHANLEVCSRGIFITDHNSTNFTYINNVQIPARERMAVCQGSSQSSVKFGEEEDDNDDGDNNDNNDETYDPDVDEDDSTDDNDSNINDDNDGVHDKSKDSKSESKTKRRYNLRKNTRKYYPK
ncbi:Protein of unknown function [Cotesia congregata]|uniref:FHA domain-containing protein n=1 Tax=Cotesia congregata TaxID=51543 RepID=A0A8J2HCR8_COTCN|nr:Protein of unknown function [Cotesia congregata]